MTVLGERYLLGTQIGQGTFSSVHAGTDIVTKESVAIKLEKRNSKATPQLAHEYQVYQDLHRERGDD